MNQQFLFTPEADGLAKRIPKPLFAVMTPALENKLKASGKAVVDEQTLSAAIELVKKDLKKRWLDGQYANMLLRRLRPHLASGAPIVHCCCVSGGK